MPVDTFLSSAWPTSVIIYEGNGLSGKVDTFRTKVIYFKPDRRIDSLLIFDKSNALDHKDVYEYSDTGMITRNYSYNSWTVGPAIIASKYYDDQSKLIRSELFFVPKHKMMSQHLFQYDESGDCRNEFWQTDSGYLYVTKNQYDVQHRPIEALIYGSYFPFEKAVGKLDSFY